MLWCRKTTKVHLSEAALKINDVPDRYLVMLIVASSNNLETVFYIAHHYDMLLAVSVISVT